MPGLSVIESNMGMERKDTEGCNFCTELDSAGSTEFSALYGRASSRMLWQSKNFVAMPTMGAIMPLHMLLLPRVHVTAFACLAQGIQEEAEACVDGLVAALTPLTGAVLAFEHGAVETGSAGGCGVLHAHLHVVPVPKDFSALPTLPDVLWREVRADKWITRCSEISKGSPGYLYFRSPTGDALVAPVGNLPSQTMRRWLAEQVGVLNWDWRAAGHELTMLESLEWMRSVVPPFPYASPASTGDTDVRTHCSQR
jgi:diadenosine tetraphosphate (Ap4A) HIT family hydrolase